MQNIPEIRQKDLVNGGFEPSNKTEMPKPSRHHSKDSTSETIKTIFYAVLIALLIRTFLFEPFNIPSGSMLPNLLIGDYLFVSKYSYGYSGKSVGYGFIDFPGRIWRTAPRRGDVIVFKLPADPSIDYIKRLVGLPGDRIEMRNGRLYINGQMLPREETGDYTDSSEKDQPVMTAYDETLPGDVHHQIIERSDYDSLDNTAEYRVPPGHYFFMGDNRDNSQDSRVLDHVGFVPEENLVGRADLIFFSLKPNSNLFEIWTWPQSIRWDRLFKRIH